MKISTSFKFLIFLLLILFLSLGCNNYGTEDRTFYDSIDLNSPETAVKSFVTAFQKNDFYSVYLIFSPSTQSTISNYISTLQYRELIKIKDREDLERVLSNTPFFTGIETWEHRTPIYLFDSMMMAAQENSAFLIDFQGDLNIIESRPNDEGGVDVEASLNSDSTLRSLIFRMQQAPSGKWRIDQVILPGGDASKVPWSLPHDASRE